MGENSGRVVLCGANAYEQKYYFNEKFSRIPESIKEELHIICVLCCSRRRSAVCSRSCLRKTGA